jgi:hypothetical protein
MEFGGVPVRNGLHGIFGKDNNIFLMKYTYYIYK